VNRSGRLMGEVVVSGAGRSSEVCVPFGTNVGLVTSVLVDGWAIGEDAGGEAAGDVVSDTVESCALATPTHERPAMTTDVPMELRMGSNFLF
jgi:hypothetical protein